MAPPRTRTRRRSSPLEEREQTDLAAWLSACLPYGTWTTTANGFLTTKAARIKAKAQGVCFGMPDVLILLQPSCWIELKRQDGKESDVKARQALVHTRLSGPYCHMEGIVANGADEAIAYVKRRYAHVLPPSLPAPPAGPV